MGQLSFPPSARVYLDTAPFIYSVEKHVDYWSMLKGLWRSVQANDLAVVTSELTLLETLVQPIRENNQTLIEAYQTLLTKTEVVLFPITTEVLRASADLRALHNFKTPDAIHAATALTSGCGFLVTNDDVFRRLANIEVVLLGEFV